MAEIISLNRHRKARARAEKDVRAAKNRVKYGISSVERAIAKAEDERARGALDSKRLGPDKPSK